MSLGDAHGAPEWLTQIAASAAAARSHELSRPTPPRDDSARESAVLLLFGETNGRPDILLTERAHTLRSHAGQVSFPGGTIDDTDAGPEAAALREAAEETGLDPGGVDVLTTVEPLWIPVSNFVVTPVVCWWRRPSPVGVVDAGEVASVHRVPLEQLLDPGNRMRVKHPRGFIGPAFQVGDLLIWGFTAGLLSRLFQLAGIEQSWDTSRVETLPSSIDDRAQAGRRGRNSREAEAS